MRGSIMQAGAAAALTIATGAGVVAFVPDAMARHHAGPLAPRDECDAMQAAIAALNKLPTANTR